MLRGILQSAATVHSPVLLETPALVQQRTNVTQRHGRPLPLASRRGPPGRWTACLTLEPGPCRASPHSPGPAVRTNLEATGQLRVLGPSQDLEHVGIAGPAGGSTCSPEGPQLLTGILGCGVNRDV